MIYRHFPKGSVLGKHLNRSTVKVSYSSLPNMARIISGHNKKVSTNMEIKGCNFRSQPCPLEMKCKTNNLVHRSTLEAAGTTKQYIGHISNTSGSWRMSRLHTINTGPSSALRHRTAGGWGSATSVCRPRRTTLNIKRHEIVAKCRHRDKVLLKHWGFVSPCYLKIKCQLYTITTKNPPPLPPPGFFSNIYSSHVTLLMSALYYVARNTVYKK